MIRLVGRTIGDRNAVINTATSAVKQVGGRVLEPSHFYDQAINLSIELPAVGYPQLRELLKEAGVMMRPPFPDELALLLTPFREEVPGSLRIDFGEAEPELEPAISAAPG